MNRIIRYAVHKEGGYVISQCGRLFAYPLRDYDLRDERGDLTQPLTYKYDLEIVGDYIGSEYALLRWTKKIPVHVKNWHRTFWGFKPLPVPAQEARP